VIQDEIEVVLKFPGQSWVALGWKPQTQDKTCASIAQYTGEIAGPTAETGKGASPEPTAGVSAEPEPPVTGTNLYKRKQVTNQILGLVHPNTSAEPGPTTGTNATTLTLPSLPGKPIVTVPVGTGNITESASLSSV
jgi:hypothetical protein